MTISLFSVLCFINISKSDFYGLYARWYYRTSSLFQLNDLLLNMWIYCILSFTSLASITVPTPTVRVMVGTLERSFPKKRALATIVSLARVFTLVLDTRLEPGSLKAMCPSGPMPKKTRDTEWRKINNRLVDGKYAMILNRIVDGYESK